MLTAVSQHAAFQRVVMIGALLCATAVLAGCPRIAPDSIAFGNVPVGTSSATWTITLTNTTTSAITLGSAKLSGSNSGDFRLVVPTMPRDIAPNTSVGVNVTFWPQALGTRVGSVAVTLGTSTTPLQLPLSGQGVPKAAPNRNYANDGSVVGTNLSPISDWSPEWAFLDCFKTSRAWFSGTASTFQDSRTLTLDSAGWVTSLQPGQFAKTLLFWAQQGTYPSGDYVVLYDGTGKLDYRNAATKIQSAPGRDLVRVDSSKGGWEFWITETDPANYLRNIRVIMPGGGSPQDPFGWWASAAACPYTDYQPFEKTYQTLVFHPAFLKTVKNYKVLRFMDWMSTNNSTQQNWSDRPTVSDVRWTTKGVPVEIMCSLANTLHANPWFCIPHMATDDYVRQFATVVRDRLAPDLKAHIEYSNEVWNSMFVQCGYAQQQGLALKLSTNTYTAGAYFTARRSTQIFSIFQSVFGGTSRIKRVLATQAAGWSMGESEIKYQDAYKQADMLAIAPYFGMELGSPSSQATVQAMSLNQLFDTLANSSIPMTYSWMDANAALARKYGLELVAYEGGQSLVGYSGVENNNTISALFDSANRDSRMGTDYTNYLNAWKARGGGLFIHYLNCLNYTKWGRWGALEHMGQTTAQAPKTASLQQYIEANR